MSDHEQTLRKMHHDGAHGIGDYTSIGPEEAAACLSGADALVREKQTCGNCKFIDTDAANEGTGMCYGPTGSISGWVPLTARCESWATREAE